MSSGLRAVAKTRQPRACMPCAAQRPMPLEQPVIRIDRAMLLSREAALPARFRRGGPLWQNGAGRKPGRGRARSEAEAELSETLSIVVSIFGLIGLGYLARADRAALGRRSARS